MTTLAEHPTPETATLVLAKDNQLVEADSATVERDVATFESLVQARLLNNSRSLGSPQTMAHPQADPQVAAKSVSLNEQIKDCVVPACIGIGGFVSSWAGSGFLDATTTGNAIPVFVLVGGLVGTAASSLLSQRWMRGRLRRMDAKHPVARITVPRSIRDAYNSFTSNMALLPSLGVPDDVLTDSAKTQQVVENLLLAAGHLFKTGRMDTPPAEQVRDQIIRHAAESHALVTIARERADVANGQDICALVEASTTRSFTTSAKSMRTETAWLATYLEDPTVEVPALVEKATAS